MPLRIRPFAPGDYAALTVLNNALYPDYPYTVEEMRSNDERRDPKCRYARWVAERDDVLIAACEYDQSPKSYHPHKFSLWVGVLPDYQGQGVGSAMYAYLLEQLVPLEPIQFKGNAREDMQASISFLLGHGFVEKMRTWESHLDVAAFDPTPYAGIEEQMRSEGIEIRTLRELESDPHYARKLYELESDLVQDVPSIDPRTPISFERFVESRLHGPNLLPDGFLVAVHNGTYVGMANLWDSKANDDIFNGLTAVKRDYRRKGIALALKLRGIAYIKQRGNPIIKTFNESNNRPMLAINERLGFVRQPAWIDYIKLLQTEE